MKLNRKRPKTIWFLSLVVNIFIATDFKSDFTFVLRTLTVFLARLDTENK